MIIDVRKQNLRREYTGELNFTVNTPQENVTLPYCEIASETQVTGTFQIFEDDSVQITGKARYLLRGACSRCLKATEKWVEVEWNPLFVKGESDGENYAYEHGVIELDQSVNDAVMLGMPYALLCDENCEGIEYDRQSDIDKHD